MIRFTLAALLSLSAATAAAAPAKAECAAIRLPFALPTAASSSDWGDAEFVAWLDGAAARYCKARPGSAWCACYDAGAYEY